MSDCPLLIKIHPNDDHVLLVEFDNGVKGQVIFTNEFITRGPFTAPLEDDEFFKQADLDGNLCVMWPNGFGIGATDIYDFIAKTGKVQY